MVLPNRNVRETNVVISLILAPEVHVPNANHVDGYNTFCVCVGLISYGNYSFHGVQTLAA